MTTNPQEQPTPRVDALFPHPGSCKWDEFIESLDNLELPLVGAVTLARTLARENARLREALESTIASLMVSHMVFDELHQGNNDEDSRYDYANNQPDVKAARAALAKPDQAL